MRAEPYLSRRCLMRTGDILVWSGEGFVSDLIKRHTGSEWSHVSLVLEDERMDTLCDWGSTTLGDLPDQITGRQIRGLSAPSLSERLQSYPGRVAWRRVRMERDVEFYQRCARLRREFHGRPYEENFLELALSAWETEGRVSGFFHELVRGMLGKRKENTDSLFCSEWVAEFFQGHAAFREPPSGRPSNRWLPYHFHDAPGVSDEEFILTGSIARAEPAVLIKG